MNRLYTLAFKRILASLSAESFGPKNTASVLESQNVKQIGSFVFHKLPRDEMRNFIKNPCPV
jgi:hypothetical protein